MAVRGNEAAQGEAWNICSNGTEPKQARLLTMTTLPFVSKCTVQQTLVRLSDSVLCTANVQNQELKFAATGRCPNDVDDD
jgi:hypothetical protein